MKKLFLAPLVIVSLVEIQLAQTTNFEKFFEFGSKAYSILQSPDGSYLLSGADRNGELLLIKTTQFGDTLWYKKYSGISVAGNYRKQMQQMSDGGFAFIGSAHDHIVVLKVDSIGNVIWKKFHFLGTYRSVGHLILNDNEKGFFIGGVVVGTSYPETYGIKLFKLNFQGNLLWQKSIPSISKPVFDAVITTQGASYIIGYDTCLTKLDSVGNETWTKFLSKRINFMIKAQDEGLVIGGEKLFIKIDSTGNDIWRKDIDFNIDFIAETKMEDIILIEDNSLTITNKIGNIILKRLQNNGYMNSIIQTNDNGLAWVGISRRYPVKFWFVKAESNASYNVLRLITPRDSNSYYANTVYPILWESGVDGNIKIEFTSNDGFSWTVVNPGILADSGTLNWLTPDIISNFCKVRISSNTNPQLIDSNKTPFSIILNSQDYIAINEIKMWFMNNGIGSSDPTTGGAGFYWPGGKFALKSAVYQDGLVFGGIMGNEIHVGGSAFRTSLQAGNILSNGLPSNPADSTFKVWKYRDNWQTLPPGNERNRFEFDYYNWPVQVGAPWIDFNNDGVYTPGFDKPKLWGDETNWMVMNAVDSSLSYSAFMSTPVGLEIHSHIYAYSYTNFLKDVIFKKYRIINKSNKTINNFILSYWSDFDLGNASDDYVGCDSTLNLGIGYNGDEYDYIYGIPPAIGYLLLQGPIVEGSSSDSAFFDDKWLKGYRNLSMGSFTPIIKGWYQGTTDPYNKGTWYNNLRGLKTVSGTPQIDPNTNLPTKFGLAGDPVKGSGWYEGTGWPGGPNPYDRRMMMNSESFTFAPSDTQEVVYAILISQKINRLTSYVDLKTKAKAVRDFYYYGILTEFKGEEKPIISDFTLSQNFPNPFNSSTNINFQIPTNSRVTLKVYDILGREVKTMINNELLNIGRYQVILDGTRLPSGVYFYSIWFNPYSEKFNETLSETKKLILIK
ncbi:MAG: T9SS type A sorting domain-containing protein [Bacteroidetes bacterium]|nr:T9SS type A sorting domain-containing protein [Bacteroidota bacterium]MBU2586224.1 T9SS type A sorting domain-containing protein [Bacteroidota bacterium]